MVVIVMGVSGCGKSTVAAEIASTLDIQFLDADDLHPPANKQMMEAGATHAPESWSFHARITT